MVGVVTIAQESRFQLMDERGVYHHFLLSHRAAAEPAELVPLQARQARVRIRYEPAANLIANIAHRIDVLEDASPT